MKIAKLIGGSRLEQQSILDICDTSTQQWGSYFEKLSSPSDNETFDSHWRSFIESQVDDIETKLLGAGS